jgi:hypothetical protein
VKPHLPARERLDLPQQGLPLGGVRGRAHGAPHSWRGGIHRDGQLDLHVGGRAALLELALGLHHELHPAARVPLNRALNPHERPDLPEKER